MANNPNILETLETEKEKLFQYASYRLPDIRDVEDVIQNLYLKALSDSNLLNNISNLKAYFYRVLSNECTDILREKSKINSVSADSIANFDFESLQPENFDEEFVLINQLLDMLPTEQSEIIRYRLHSNLSFQEIADIMNNSASTVKARFRYGIEKIKTNLKKQNLL
ncbi:MAG: RNA polymerase sigma factor [Muribaculaceae bacterium]|nr:RNA polymerase sigma factor [Muribaculaceae bacterium]